MTLIFYAVTILTLGELLGVMALFDLTGAIRNMALDLSSLAAQVAATSDAANKAVALIQGLAAQDSVDPAAIAALTAQLKTATDALSAAISGATPAPPPPPATFNP